MTLHIFNPDHDIALAHNKDRFTAPHAGRHLRSDLGYIPALWAEDGDVIIVEDVEYALSAYKKIKLPFKPNISFVTPENLHSILCTESCDIDHLSVWGWNKSIRWQLESLGVPSHLLPKVEQIAAIRTLSSRKSSIGLLQTLRSTFHSFTCGESVFCVSEEDLKCLLDKKSVYSQAVVKAPWSSSGRGVRYLTDAACNRSENTWNWIRNTIREQGGVMVEPFYNKVKDFALEFTADELGNVEYCGLSIFETQNGAYVGNLLATNDEKENILSHYISLNLLHEVIMTIEKNLNVYPYHGPLGIDMMIVPNASGLEDTPFLLHPCVEINLRRTMGHVALAISPSLAEQNKIMRISYDGKKYRVLITSKLS